MRQRMKLLCKRTFANSDCWFIGSYNSASKLRIRHDYGLLEHCTQKIPALVTDEIAPRNRILDTN